MNPQPPLVWEDPPPSQRGRWGRVAQQLAAQPEKWALVATIDYGILSAATKTLQRNGCETTSRSNGNNTCRLYARYVGKDKT
jgi:hypothetical protein